MIEFEHWVGETSNAATADIIAVKVNSEVWVTGITAPS